MDENQLLSLGLPFDLSSVIESGKRRSGIMDLSLSLTPLLLHQTTIELGSKNEGIVTRMYCVQRMKSFFSLKNISNGRNYWKDSSLANRYCNRYSCDRF